MKTGNPIQSCIFVLIAMMLFGCIIGASIQSTVNERNIADIRGVAGSANLQFSDSFRGNEFMTVEKMVSHRSQHVVAFWCMWSTLTVITCLSSYALLEESNERKSIDDKA